MTDLFSITPPAPPSKPSIAVCEAPNNDVVLVRFAVEGGPEQEALGRVRVSDSIHKLRHRHGLGIETERVGHGGIYSGDAASARP